MPAKLFGWGGGRWSFGTSGMKRRGEGSSLLIQAAWLVGMVMYVGRRAKWLEKGRKKSKVQSPLRRFCKFFTIYATVHCTTVQNCIYAISFAVNFRDLLSHLHWMWKTYCFCYGHYRKGYFSVLAPHLGISPCFSSVQYSRYLSERAKMCFCLPWSTVWWCPLRHSLRDPFIVLWWENSAKISFYFDFFVVRVPYESTYEYIM